MTWADFHAYAYLYFLQSYQFQITLCYNQTQIISNTGTGDAVKHSSKNLLLSMSTGLPTETYFTFQYKIQA